MAEGFSDSLSDEYYIQRYEEWRASLSPEALAQIAAAKAARAQLLRGNLDDDPGWSGGAGVPSPVMPPAPVRAGGNAEVLPKPQSMNQAGAGQDAA